VLSPEGETSVYRIAQEGLNNVLKALPRDRGQNPAQVETTGHLGQDNGGEFRGSLDRQWQQREASAWRDWSERASSVVLLRSTRAIARDNNHCPFGVTRWRSE
jgi:hypothetical protein